MKLHKHRHISVLVKHVIYFNCSCERQREKEPERGLSCAASLPNACEKNWAGCSPVQPVLGTLLGLPRTWQWHGNSSIPCSLPGSIVAGGWSPDSDPIIQVLSCGEMLCFPRTSEELVWVCVCVHTLLHMHGFVYLCKTDLSQWRGPLSLYMLRNRLPTSISVSLHTFPFFNKINPRS